MDSVQAWSQFIVGMCVGALGICLFQQAKILRKMVDKQKELEQRQAEWMKLCLEWFGMSIGVDLRKEEKENENG